MTKKYQIEYLELALSDLVEIFNYLIIDDLSRAEVFLEELDASISRLENFPKLGFIPKDEKIRNLGYRILVIKKYLVFYLIKETTVEIHRIFHGSRDYLDLIS